MFQSTKAQRRKIKRALRERDANYVIKSALFHFRISHHFTLARHNYKMRVFYTPFSFWLWTEGRERSDEYFYKRFLREGDIVIDAGANIGLCTLLSAKIIGEGGHIYSFEPHPRTFRQLVSNTKLNNLSNVTLYNKGVGDKEECVNFSDEYVSDINHVDTHGKKKVSITSLDNELKDTLESEVTFFKLDVEGYELFALHGAKQVLKKTKVVYFEHNPRSFGRYGYSFKNVFDFLEKLGFSIYKEVDGVCHRVKRDYISLAGYENLLAIRDEDVGWLESRLKQ